MKRGFKLILFVLISVTAAYSVFCEGFVYDDNGKRDPFVPLVGVARVARSGLENVRSINDVKLQGIALDASGRASAILNGEIVFEGAEIGRVKLLKVEKNSVTLKINGKEYKLKLYKLKGGI